MSRRKRAAPPPAREREPERAPARALRPLGPTLLRDAAVLLGVFAGVTLIAELLGAANLGVAIGVAAIAYAVVLMWLMLRR